MNADGTNPVQLTKDESAEHKPNWFPDSSRIGYMSKRGDLGGLWSVDITTRREELVFDFAGAKDFPNLAGSLAEFDPSPSVKHLAISMLTPPTGQRMLYVSPIGKFEPRRLGPLGVGYPAWSPDEKQIAVEIKDGSSTHAGVIDVGTGVMKHLTKERGHTWVRSWSPDGRRIVLAVMRDTRWSLRWIDVASGHEGAFTAPYPPNVYLRYPEWSPVNDRVVFERGVTRGNIWTIAVD
jgi:Tol biopolymer transport system component